MKKKDGGDVGNCRKGWNVAEMMGIERKDAG
jgi:hypothetical protein